jgi:hypothetical protein
MKFLKIVLAATALASTPAVFAQDAAPADAATSALTVGATVMGNDGNPVGTIEAISGDVVLLNTGKHQAPIPAAAVGSDATGLSVNITQAQLNEMMDAQVAEAQARRDAALVAGAEAMTPNGNPAGTIVSADLDADAIIFEGPTGRVAMKKEHFAVDGETLVVLFTRADIESAAAAAAAAAGTGAAN